MSTPWIVVTEKGEAAALLNILGNPENAFALAIGPRGLAEEAACGTAGVVWIDTQDKLAESYANAAAESLLACEDAIAVGYATPAVCGAFGIAASKVQAPVISNVVKVSLSENGAEAEHATVDSKVIETVSMPAPAYLLADTVSFQPVEADSAAPKGDIKAIAATPSGAIELVDSSPIPPSGIESADCVVGVGRGINSEEKFALAQRLANALGAELSGTMPGVRDFGHFDENADYIGLSGVRLNAKAYIALGISGSTPHLPGIANCQRVVCINKDEDAALFNHADYGIVGDVEEIVPKLIEALS